MIDDVWLRYHDERDVLEWARFIERLLPEPLVRFRAAVAPGGLA